MSSKPPAPAPEGVAVRSKAPTVNTGGEMGQILDHLLCASDKKIRYQDAKDALKLHDREKARADAAEAEVAELKKLLAPEVLAAAQLIALNADAHPAGCCHECSAGLAQRDALLKALREIAGEVCDAECGIIAAAAIKEASNE